MNADIRKIILLVEDEAIVAMVETKILEKHGFRVILAKTGEQALEIVCVVPHIDLILMDIDLGEGINGIVTAEKILKEKNLPLIFLSAHTEQNVLEKTEGVTSYGCIVKNSGEMELITSIKMAFRLFESRKMEYEKEVALEKSEARLRATLENTPNVAVQWYDEQGRVLYWNSASEKLYGWKASEAIGKTLDELIYTKAEAEEYLQILNQIKNTGEPFGPFEVNVCRKDGSMGSIIYTTFAIPLGEKEIGFACMDVDVSKTKKTEEALKNSENRLASICENFTEGMIYQVIVTEDGLRRFTFLSDSVKSLYGISPEEAIKDPSLFYRQIHKDDVEALKRAETEAARTTSAFRQECRVKNALGEERWSSFVSIPRRLEDGTLCFDGIESIITDRKLAERALKESEQLFKQLYEDSPSGIALFNESGVLEKANSKLGEFFGVPSENLIGKTLEELAGRFDLNGIEQHKNFLKRINGTSSMKELSFVNHLGEKTTVTVQSSVMMKHDKFVGVLYQFSDITERKRMEEGCREDKEKFEIIFNTSPDAVIISRLEDGKIVSINEGFTELTGYTNEDVNGKSSVEICIWAKAKDRDGMVQMLREQGKCENLECVFRRKNGTDRCGIFSAKIIKIKGVQHIISVTRDISEWKQSEEKIKALLVEKELMLREVHHRIKNNMNAINGFLALQAAGAKDPAIVEALDDAGSRIQSMMVLYDKLYSSTDYTEVSVKEYIPALVKQIVSNFPNKELVSIETDIEDFYIDSKRLSTIGIIINELMTNIMKYAFAGRATGLITVELFQRNNKVLLMLEDDGNGIPKSIDFQSSTGFGLMLIELLTKQIGGSINIERENGTKIILEFEK